MLRGQVVRASPFPFASASSPIGVVARSLQCGAASHNAGRGARFLKVCASFRGGRIQIRQALDSPAYRNPVEFCFHPPPERCIDLSRRTTNILLRDASPGASQSTNIVQHFVFARRDSRRGLEFRRQCRPDDGVQTAASCPLLKSDDPRGSAAWPDSDVLAGVSRRNAFTFPKMLSGVLFALCVHERPKRANRPSAIQYHQRHSAVPRLSCKFDRNQRAVLEPISLNGQSAWLPRQ